MRLIISIILFISIISRVQGQNHPDTISIDTIVRRLYPNDTIFVRYKITTSDTTSRWDKYFLNGQKSSETTYLNGIWHGSFYYWYKSGKLQSKLDYQYGKFSGDYISYYDSGKLESQADFSNKDTATIHYYHKSGNLSRLEICKSDGELIGKRYSYYDNGQLAFYQNFDNEVDSVLGYFDNGVSYKKGLAYKSAFPCGYWIYRFEDGTLEKEGNYRDCSSENSYTKIGVWKYYDHGELIKIEHFDNDGKLIKEESIVE